MARTSNNLFVSEIGLQEQMALASPKYRFGDNKKTHLLLRAHNDS
jgi:hypothetical protein